MNPFDRVIGYSSEKKELEQIGDILKNRGAYEKLGVSAPRGLLLYGEPGVGKTLMSDALIQASGRKTFTCRKDQPDGDFIKAIKTIFEQAAENAPSIVFLDDMDKFANGDEMHRDAEEYVTVQSCIDAIRDKEVFVLATANNIRNLPRSLLRAGRFDRIIKIEAPRGEDAVKIITHYLKGKKFVSGIDPVTIARIMDGRSCAELETVINEAGLYAGFNRADEITMEHFMEACLKTIFKVPVDVFDDEEEDFCINLSDGSRMMSQVVYHEAGHAVVSEVLHPGSVTLISAHSRNGKNGGFTSYYNDNTLPAAKWEQNNVLSSLGGMAAIEQKFGICDIGNSSDLDHAFGKIRSLIEKTGICGFSLHSYNYDDSALLRTKQELSVSAEIERYYRKTKEILILNMPFLDAVAKALAQKGLLTMNDIKEIRESCGIVPVAV